MGPDEKDTGPLTVYMDGQPVGIAGGEIPEISLAEEKPGIYLEGEAVQASCGNSYGWRKRQAFQISVSKAL